MKNKRVHKMTAGSPVPWRSPKTAGHRSISAPAICTARLVGGYFETAELPENGMVCEADV